MLPCKQMRSFNSYKLKRSLLLMLYLLLGYKLTQIFAWNYHGSYSSLKSGLDLAIPFWAPSVLVYISMYAYIPLVLLMIADQNSFIKIFKLFVILSVIHWFWFFIFPVSYQERVPDEVLFSVLGFVVWVIYSLDLPLNCFPSMHVSLVFLGLFVVGKFRPDLFRYYLVWAVAIALSTLLVKQHYILDVLGGCVLGLVVGWFGFRGKNANHSWIP